MRSFAVLSGLAAVAVAAIAPINTLPRTSTFPILSGGVIVELSPGTTISGKRDADPHAEFFNDLEKRAIDFTTRRTFSSSLFNGVSLQLANPSDLVKLASTKGVLAVRPITVFQPPKIFNKIIPKGVNDPAVPPDSESTHVMTGVDKVHALGLTGKGITIGIIDTGTDFTNPVLGGCFGPGCKVAGGFDFVGNAFDGTNTPVPGPIPLDQCNGHGTHVAGIIGANPGNEFNISGVVFDATIFSYRVFGCTGTVPDDVLVEALLQGVSDKMDILTMSLGGADGWTESTTSVLSSRIADQGIPVTIAAGNDGQFGTFFTSGPGNGIDAISAASVDNIVTPVQSVTTNVAHAPIPYFALFPLPVGGAPFPIFATSTDTTIVDDACNPLPANTPNLANLVTVVRRGTCTFVQKLTNIAAFGGNIVLIYNNGGSLGAIDTGNFTNAVLIEEADGDFLVQEFAAGVNITVTFPQTGGVVNLPNTATGGLVSSFTSWGPTNDMFFKPAVAAPGGNILSTFPVPLGSFAILSGTSMATPFTAGSVGLLIQAKGKGITSTVRTLLETTAQSIPQTLTDSLPPQSLAQQGAGLINVFNAISFKTVVSPGELLLNDTANFKALHTITVKNTGNTIQTYKLTHVPAGTALTLAPGSPNVQDTVTQTTDFASVVIVPSTLIVPPGFELPVIVTIIPPKTNQSTLPVISGFIQITSKTENLHVSYLGLAGSLKEAQVVDNTDAFFGVESPFLLDASSNIQTGDETYTFVGEDFPTLFFRLSMGTPAFKLDLVSPNITVQTDLKKRFFSWWWPGLPKSGGSFAKIPTLGSLAEFDFLSRNDDDPTEGFDSLPISPATFANGTTIPNGTFKLLMRVLKITGDPTNEADYEVFLSPPITVAQPAA